MFKQAYKAAESSYRKSQTTQHQNSAQEALHSTFKCHANFKIFFFQNQSAKVR